MIILNKVVGIGIVVVVIAVIIGAVMSFSNDSVTPGTTVTQVGPFTVESSNEYSEEESVNGTDHSIILYEKIGVKTP